jgi:Immunity protein 50
VEGVDNINGAEQLVAIFGYWPSFHDAEMLWLTLDRQSRGEGCYGPTLDALVHAFEMTSEVDRDGYYVLRNHVLVHLRFSEVVELQIAGFNHQNALMGLALTDVSDRQMERVKWEVRFDSAFGVDASFQCYNLEVVSVVPCDKTGKPV